jgi:hypothetical protein
MYILIMSIANSDDTINGNSSDNNTSDIIHASSVIIVAIISWAIQAFKSVLIKNIGTGYSTSPDKRPVTVRAAAKSWFQVFTNLVGGINKSVLNLANNTESFAANGILNFIPWLGNPNIIQRSSIKKELLDRTTQLNSIMTPDVKQDLQRLIVSLINLNIDILSDVTGPAENMIDNALGVLTTVGEKAARGIMSLIINVAMSAVGEIPVVGGILDLIMSILRGINSGFQTGAPMAQALTSGLVTSILTIKQVFKGLEQINDETKVSVNDTKGVGGGRIMNKNSKKKKRGSKKTKKNI